MAVTKPFAVGSVVVKPPSSPQRCHRAYGVAYNSIMSEEGRPITENVRCAFLAHPPDVMLSTVLLFALMHLNTRRANLEIPSDTLLFFFFFFTIRM